MAVGVGVGGGGGRSCETFNELVTEEVIFFADLAALLTCNRWPFQMRHAIDIMAYTLQLSRTKD